MLDILLEISCNQTFLNLLSFQLLVINSHGYLTHVRFTIELLLSNPLKGILNRYP